MIYRGKCRQCGHQREQRGGDFRLEACQACFANRWDLIVTSEETIFPSGWEEKRKTEKEWTVQASYRLIDLVLLALSLCLSLTVSPLWWLLVAACFVSIFGKPRWSKAEGWRLKRDE